MSNTAVVVACVGKLVKGKRVSDFVQALADARRRNLSLHGVIVGSGPEQASLERLARELEAPVTFLGFRNQTELPACLAACDLLAMPSESETWGLAVNEAMACGLPVAVSSGVGCERDLVIEDRTGWVFPVGDVPAIVGALERASHAVRTRRAEFDKAVARQIDDYSLEAAVDGTLTALTKLGRTRLTRQAESMAVR